MKFCGMCGASLVAVCPGCGFLSPPGMNFCGQCGSPLAPGAPYAAPSQPQYLPPMPPQYYQQYQPPPPHMQVPPQMQPPPQMAPQGPPQAPAHPPLQMQPPPPQAPPQMAPQAPPQTQVPPSPDTTAQPAAPSAQAAPPQEQQASAPAPAKEAPRAGAMTRRDELKTVTVLFSDVKGSTAMGERLPPDEVKDIMNDCLSLLEAEILKRDGTIDKYLGDGLMALFGAPVSHENDPERAVDAALNMQEQVKEFAKKMEKRAGTLLELRIGVNTGKVLAGHIGKEHADYTVMGDAVNLASRLESNATPGGVLISHDTFRHVRKKFVCEPKGPISVKGLKRQVRVYDVVGRKEEDSIAFTFEVAGVHPKMVGRDIEMGILRDTLERTVTEKKPKLVTVFGERGVGKSRLLHEFMNYVMGLSRAAMISLARCVGTPPHSYWLISELIKAWAGAGRHATAEEFQGKFLKAVERLISDEHTATETAHFIAALVGSPYPDSPHTKPYEADPKMLQQIAFKSLTTLFGRAGARQPLLLVAEDVHHADTGSMEALLYLSMAVENASVLIVATAREEEFQSRDMFVRDLPSLVNIRIQPLGAKACGDLLDEMFRNVGMVTPQAKESIIQKGEGNPYYVEEIVKDLIDREVIKAVEAKEGEPQWEMSDVGGDLGVPQTLEGLVQTRVDRLPLNHKILLQEASSVGKDFWEGAVSVIEKESDPHTFEGSPVDVTSRLSEMEKRDFTYRKPISHFAGEVEYAFKQSFMQEVVYGSIPSKMRYKFHASIAEWLDEKGKEAPDQYHALLAHHYECARDEENAATHYRAAAAVSKKLNDNRDAITMYNKVLELTSENNEAVKEAKDALGKLYLITSDFAKSEESYQEYLELCTEGLEKAGAFVSLGRLDEARGEYAEALEHYSEAEKQLASVKPEESATVRGRILRGKAGVHMRRGESDQALELGEQALEVFGNHRKALGEPDANADAIASTLNAKGLAFQQKGDLEASMQDFLKALKEYRRVGDKRGEGMVLNNIGIIHFNKGDLDSAEDYYTRSRDISGEVGDMQGRANAISNVGLINQTKCRYEKAIEELGIALDIRRRMGDRAGLANSLINLVIIYLIVGHSDRADEILAEMSELCQAEEHKVWRWYETYCRGEALRLTGEFDASKESFGKARELAQEMKNPTMEGWSVQSMAQLALSAGNCEDAIDVAAEAGKILGATGDEKAVLGVRLVGIEALMRMDRLDDVEKELGECGDVEEKYAGDRDILFHYLKAEGTLKEKRGDAEAAKDRYLKAMSQRESIRSELSDPELAEAYDNRPEMKEIAEALARVGGQTE